MSHVASPVIVLGFTIISVLKITSYTESDAAIVWGGKFCNVLMYLLSVSTASTTIPALMWRFCVKCRSEDYCSKCGSQTPNLEYIMPKVISVGTSIQMCKINPILAMTMIPFLTSDHNRPSNNW